MDWIDFKHDKPCKNQIVLCKFDSFGVPLAWKPKEGPDDPIDDKNYLVFWKEDDGKWSIGHRAYYLDGKFFSLETMHSHPLHVDKFIEMPSLDNKE